MPDLRGILRTHRESARQEQNMARQQPPQRGTDPQPAQQQQQQQQGQDEQTPQMQSGTQPQQPPRFRDWASI
jgi:Sec-independent protein translocase protein TatA